MDDLTEVRLVKINIIQHVYTANSYMEKRKERNVLPILFLPFNISSTLEVDKQTYRMCES